MSMRTRFYSVATSLLDEDERVAVVLAAIGAGELPQHPRVFNVGIREQLMIGVAAGLALEGMRPVVHSYTPFLVERPYEQIKLDLGHQDVGAVLVSTGASYDASRSGRTHQAPEDVAVLAALPGWTIHVPGHADEVERLTRAAVSGDGRVYIRLSDEENVARFDGDGLVVLRSGSGAAPVVIAVGPALGPTLEATADLNATVAYLATVRPSSSRTSPARRRPRSRRRSATARTDCSRSARRTPSSGITARAPSTAPHTVSTPSASARLSTPSWARRRRADCASRPALAASSDSGSRSGGSARA